MNTQTKALQAIVARIQGNFDEPALVAHGPLRPDTKQDCLAIAEAALNRSSKDKQSVSTFTCTIHCVDCSKVIRGNEHEALYLATESAISKAEFAGWDYFNHSWRCVECSNK